MEKRGQLATSQEVSGRFRASRLAPRHQKRSCSSRNFEDSYIQVMRRTQDSIVRSVGQSPMGYHDVANDDREVRECILTMSTTVVPVTEGDDDEDLALLVRTARRRPFQGETLSPGRWSHVMFDQFLYIIPRLCILGTDALMCRVE